MASLPPVMAVPTRVLALAVATWSVGWNFGPGWEATLLDGYRVATDPGRACCCRLVYDLGP